ncbi:MAG: hydroxymethylglutaryl-CoA reductase [Candidatus Thorarchaeota archaeon]|jgi:hydroxymethylglutaryl-CoA reductase (NADPH)
MTKIRDLLKSMKIAPHRYETFLHRRGNTLSNGMLYDCIKLRRETLGISHLPYDNYDYRRALNKNCENMIGYTRIPTGVVGPVEIDGVKNMVPFSTSEGALVSSINRGVKLLNRSETQISVEDIGMTRAPIVKCKTIKQAKQLKEWITENYKTIKEVFETDSRHTKLQDITFLQEGRHLHIRFRATTGEAMGMNMVGKGSGFALKYIKSLNDDLRIISLSGNTCTDKKANAINWINGRGKCVVMEACIPKEFLRKILRVTPEKMEYINVQKNLVGSSLAGTIGGNNCNTTNVVAGIFLSAGQDLGQIGTSSQSILNLHDNSDSLISTLTMPCLEIGTVGGGTTLQDQEKNIDMIADGSTNKVERLAKNIAYCVMACELSLLASLCNNDLIDAHMRFNRGCR